MIWHYTIEAHLRNIMADGMIKTTREQRGNAVWFSKDPIWEQTVIKGLGWRDPDDFGKRGRVVISQSKEELYEHCGLARIGVADHVAPYTWDDFRKLSGLTMKELNGLRKIAYERGARVGDWRVCFEPVFVPDWESIETWDGTAWQPHREACIVPP